MDTEYPEKHDPRDPREVDKTDHLPEERHTGAIFLEHKGGPEQKLDPQYDSEERDDSPVVKPKRIAKLHRARSSTSRYAVIVRSEIGPQESSRVIFSCAAVPMIVLKGSFCNNFNIALARAVGSRDGTI
ncbi:hypothetical protein DSECCO2_602820 [anaerobic digester metagenome]